MTETSCTSPGVVAIQSESISGVFFAGFFLAVESRDGLHFGSPLCRHGCVSAEMTEHGSLHHAVLHGEVVNVFDV